MHRSILLSAVLFAFVAASTFGPLPVRASDDLHAAEGAKPGSYEDWCAEHKVAESQCTRCDKSLIPVFKATGDWCELHGLPKSQDLKCNPDLKIVRPPKQGA
ncbi:hypothetical protein DESUT3_19630 [Desulfuromonas versatilis]|uniref:Uncharacterized protein n=1 Tax=Desulfuromonas versatilis TaxID=2802975 RepID=A0ABN6E0A0_9BACT|nr:hypothetical protein [Desulfuromonas versatilis]BCR04894.1 hypothetical protein DESUT3_19630 [Desulfuromonas versatilis]